jgi:hypothetical protein
VSRHGVCIAQNGPGITNFVTGLRCRAHPDTNTRTHSAKRRRRRGVLGALTRTPSGTRSTKRIPRGTHGTKRTPRGTHGTKRRRRRGVLGALAGGVHHARGGLGHQRVRRLPGIPGSTPRGCVQYCEYPLYPPRRGWVISSRLGIPHGMVCHGQPLPSQESRVQCMRGRGEPSPGAGGGGVSPVPVPPWAA